MCMRQGVWEWASGGGDAVAKAVVNAAVVNTAAMNTAAINAVATAIYEWQQRRMRR